MLSVAISGLEKIPRVLKNVPTFFSDINLFWRRGIFFSEPRMFSGEIIFFVSAKKSLPKALVFIL